MKAKRHPKHEFTTVSIPTKLFKKVEDHISETGFPSVSSYVAFLLRVLLSETKGKGNKKAEYEAGLIKKKLEELGYS
ncbi:MAG: CopG family transcriptional regulator [Candidatus Micrarchaeia archaeon]